MVPNGTRASSLETREYASLWVVVKNLAQTRGGKIGSSHEAVLSLIGQRLTSVSALGGLRYFKAAAP